MFGIIGNIAGAIDKVADLLNGVTEWLQRKERDKLVREAENAQDKQAVIDRHRAAARARAERKRSRVLERAEADPANRDG